MYYISNSDHHICVELHRNRNYVMLYDEYDEKHIEITRSDLRRKYWSARSGEDIPFWMYVMYVYHKREKKEQREKQLEKQNKKQDE